MSSTLEQTISLLLRIQHKGIFNLNSEEQSFAQLTFINKVSILNNDNKSILTWRSGTGYLLGFEVTEEGFFLSKTGICDSSNKLHESNIQLLSQTKPEIYQKILDEIADIKVMLIYLSHGNQNYFK